MMMGHFLKVDDRMSAKESRWVLPHWVIDASVLVRFYWAICFSISSRERTLAEEGIGGGRELEVADDAPDRRQRGRDRIMG